MKITHKATDGYRTWKGMRQRCTNPNDNSFRFYGGRGITICPEWDSFDQFMADMGPRPSPLHTLDRIDVNGHYCPGNCRWATASEQSNNRTNNIRVSFDGTTMNLKQWCFHLKKDYGAIRSRLRRGMTFYEAVTVSECPIKLSSHQVRRIHLMLSIGTTQKHISRLFGVNPSNISVIASGKSWRNLHPSFSEAY